jgi:signal peptidase II
MVPPAAPGGRVWFGVLIPVVVLIDQASKYLIFAADPWYRQRPLPLTDGSRAWEGLPIIWCTQNPGAAWSLGAEWPGLIALLTLVLIPVLGLIYWRAFRPTARRMENACFGAIIGGALGNAYDRMVAWSGIDPGIRGVRDFIHVDLGFWPCHPWPTFNLADSALTVAVAVLIIAGFAAKPRCNACPPGSIDSSH